MSDYDLMVSKPIKELVYLKLNNQSLKENSDYIILKDKQTIRLISRKAKRIYNSLSNKFYIAEYKEEMPE